MMYTVHIWLVVNC